MTQSGDALKNICWAKAAFGRTRLPAVPYNIGNSLTARLKAVPSHSPARQTFLILICLWLPLCAIYVSAESTALVLEHNGSTIALEPYAPNIIRVTLSLQKDQALAAPGFGFIANAAAEGWSHQHIDTGDIYQSPRMIVRVDASHPGGTPPLTIRDISKFFNGSAPGAHITITTPDGKTLLDMTGWSMSVPNHKDGNASVLNDQRPSDPEFFQVGATFVSPDDEHYYGLGQNQEGFLDHRGHTVECWHNYMATGGPSVCVPFLVSNYGYGLVWDNPSKTTIEPGFNEQHPLDLRGRRSRFVLS